MDSPRKLSRRERFVRLAGGLAVVALGCAVFAYSKAHDPANRAALLGIVGILVGLTWCGQGLRGRKDGPIRYDEGPAEARSVSAERAAFGILAGWLVPGLGHWLIGRRAKALLFFFTITLTFVAGVALADGRNLSFERDSVFFLAYMFNLGETLLAWSLTHGLELDHEIAYLQLGFLYAAVACLLNLVVMMDFFSTCGRVPPARGTPAERAQPGGPSRAERPEQGGPA